MRAEDFADVTEVNVEKNYIVLFDKEGYRIVMPIEYEDGKLGFNNRYGDSIPPEIPEYVRTEDMKMRLQNKLFCKEAKTIGKLKSVNGKELDVTAYPDDEPNPSPETIVKWLYDRGSELTAMVIERLVALKKGDKKKAEELEKLILEYPKKHATTVTPVPTPTTEREVFVGNGSTTKFRLSKPYSTIDRVSVDGVIQYEGTDYKRYADNQTIIFVKPPAKDSVIEVEYTPAML